MFFGLIAVTLVAASVLAACNTAATTIAPTAIPATLVASPVPVLPTATVPATPMAADTATPTLAATSTVAGTDTPTGSAIAQVIPEMNANCRKGPETGYDVITFLQTGTAYNVVGRNSLNTWWLVQAPGNVQCWIGDQAATEQGPVDQATIAQVPPLPVAPSLFVSSYTCNTTLHTLGVSLNWAAVQNVTGYSIYRNGIVLIELGPTIDGYHDTTPPLGVNVVYELEAFNTYGVAPRVSTSIPGCG
ncbi:MAG: SH3 domain-containing protein [Anaerolineales bacterium]